MNRAGGRRAVGTGHCRDCAEYTSGRRGASWGECKSVQAKEGLHHPAADGLAVRADFGCVHWRGFLTARQDGRPPT